MSPDLRRGITCACALALCGPTANVQAAEPPATHAAPAPAPLSPPVLRSSSDVPYPAGGEGDATVVLTLTIDPDGTVSSAVPSDAREPFAGQASAAAHGWFFTPAMRGDKPVAARIRVEVVFHAPVEAKIAEPEVAKPAAHGAAPAPQEVTVHGDRPEPSRTVTLSRSEVRQIPGVFGDPFRAIEIMPGVTPIVSGLPFFFVRGAPPGDVGYFLDGVRVPYLFHVGAGPSVIHPGLIDTVDLYPGGYPARFGRFSGGIVSGETLKPATELHGEYNVRLFDAGALAELPFADGRGTILLSGRYSYTGALLTLLSSNTVLNYWDYQGRASYKLTPHDTVSVFAFGAYDYLGQKVPNGPTQTVFGADFHRVDLRYDHALGSNGNLRLAATGGIDSTAADPTSSVRDRMIGLRSELVYRLAPALTFRGGTDVEADRYDVVADLSQLNGAQAQVASLFPSRTDLAIGTRGDFVIDVTRRLTVTPGARFDFYSSEGATAVSIDPRIAARTVITSRTRLLVALGLAHQPPAFVIPIPGVQPGGLRGGLQDAVQESMGFETDLGQQTTATATVFHNGFFNMSDVLSVTPPQISGCPPGSFPSGTLSGDPETQPTGNGRCGQRFPPGTVGGDRSGGGGQAVQSQGDVQTAQAFATRARGTAYGVEFFLKRKLTNRIGGFVSYTLSRSTRSANGQDFIATFDRTHVLNAAVAYDLGHNWRAGTRVTFYTGLPKAPDPSDPGSTRLAPFFRLDLRLEKRWQLGPKAWISFVAEWMNATLSKESVGTNCTLNGCQDEKIGPVTIPSLGVEGGF